MEVMPLARIGSLVITSSNERKVNGKEYVKEEVGVGSKRWWHRNGRGAGSGVRGWIGAGEY